MHQSIQYLFLFVLSVSILWACKQEPPQQQFQVELPKAIIEVEITNMEAVDSLSLIGIYSRDNLTKELTASETPINQNGRHRYELELSEQQEVLLLYESFLSLILQPGDSIYITMDGRAKTKREILRSQKITGTSTRINENLRQYNLGQPVEEDSIRAKYQRLNPYDYKDYIDSIYAEQARYIDTLLANNVYSEPLTNWFEAQKLYGITYSVSFYDYYLPPKEDDTNSEMAIPTDQVNLLKYNIDSIPVLEDRYRINYWAGNDLPQSLNNLLHKTIREDDALCSSQYVGCFIEQVPKLYGHRPDLSQAVMYELVQSLLIQGLTFVYEEKKTLVDSVLAGSDYEGALANSYNDYLERIKTKEIPPDVVVTELPANDAEALVQELLAANPGKFLYLNHWYTPCSMCLLEYTGSTQLLKKDYNDKLAFVYLCYECNEPQWKAVITKFDLSGTHYFLDKEQASKFKKTFDIKGYPTYTLIDSTGVQLGNDFELRPSNRVIYDLLREHSKNE